MPARRFTVRLTDKQVEAVQAASRLAGISDEEFSEQLRGLIAGSLALYGIEWPETPPHGGRREGAGRKPRENGI